MAYLVACSSGGPEAPATSEAPDQSSNELQPELGGNESLESGAVELAIEGRSGVMGAQAALHVVEGEEDVPLTIAGAQGDTDFVYIDVTLHGVESSMGVHVFEMGLPARAEHVANVGLDGTQYYSQGGRVEVILNPNGTIEGTFEVILAPDRAAVGPMGEPVFEMSDETTTLSGSFTGDWRLSCQSRLAGHSTLVLGGEYCNGLTF